MTIYLLITLHLIGIPFATFETFDNLNRVCEARKDLKGRVLILKIDRWLGRMSRKSAVKQIECERHRPPAAWREAAP